MQRREFVLFADYFQFYIQDESAKGDLSDSWTDEAVARLLAVAPGAIGFGTVRNMEVHVSVEMHDVEPPLELEVWEHIVECALEASSGSIVVAGCTDYLPDAARIEVAPGAYRVRFSATGLKTLSEDGLHGNDRYLLQLWGASKIEPTVIKQRVA